MFRNRILAFVGFVVMSLVSLNLFALSERHVIVIRSAEAQHNIDATFNSDPREINYRVSNLTTRGKQQSNLAAERLAIHGFDNRNIVAVYVSPLPRAMQTATIMSNYGIFTMDKIHPDARLQNMLVGALEGRSQKEIKQDPWHFSQGVSKKYEVETNRHVRNRMLAFYDEIESKHKDGHVLIIGHGLPAMELLQEIVQIEVRLNPSDTYILPLTDRKTENKA